MKNLDSKVAFVTGGASGIGLGMAKNFIGEGMKVTIADWNDEHLAQARAALRGSNAVHFIKVDVGDRDQVRAAADEALSVFGKIHVLCNNAGVGGGGTTDSPDFEDWDKALRVNLGGVVNGTKIIVPHIRAHGEGGHVVNTASMAGVVPLPMMGAYATAKYAVRGFTDNLRMSLAPEGIGVSCLFPGATKTQLLSLAAPETPQDVAAEPDMIRKLRKAIAVAMDPVELGAMVVAAIRENRRYIFTHREFLDEVIEMNREMEAAFPQAQEIPEARKAFEDARWAAEKALQTMPAKDG
jgi:NAD(P)-dependent dehydrogenase (short-subunit alcohol dehydrogenase family)